jgi:hypothetical protein
MASPQKTYIKAGLIAIAVVTAIVLVKTHPIISVLLLVAGVAFWLIDSGKVNV